jgi:hypothetical protein
VVLWLAVAAILLARSVSSSARRRGYGRTTRPRRVSSSRTAK